MAEAPTNQPKHQSKLPWIILGIVSAVVVVGVVILLAGWSYVKGTPQYSLYQADQAVKHHDYAAFRQYVDVDAVVGTVIDQAAQKAEAEQIAKVGAENQQLVSNLVDGLKPGLKAEAQKQLKQEVEDGTFQKNGTAGSLAGAFSQTKVTNRSGHTVTVSIKGQDGKYTIAKMRKVGGHWQVFELPIDTSKIGQ